MKLYLPNLIIQQHKGLHVVRGDLYQGGIKCRVLTELFAADIKEEEVVYAGCYFGHSGFALGLAGLATDKRIALFLPSPHKDTYIQRQVESLNNVTCHIVEAEHQDGAVAAAREYAEKTGGYLLPVGFDYPAFTDRYIALMQSLDIHPEEVWVSGGSGVSARCLIRAFPNARINVINLNVRSNAQLGSPYKVRTIPEPLSTPASAEKIPPYPSALYYDAKIWQVVQEHAKPGAFVWNIA